MLAKLANLFASVGAVPSFFPYPAEDPVMLRHFADLRVLLRE